MGASDKDQVQEYRSPLCCPRCFWHPALGFSLLAVEWSRTLDPEDILGTVKCERKNCRDPVTGGPTIMHITADALQRAVPWVKSASRGRARP